MTPTDHTPDMRSTRPHALHLHILGSGSKGNCLLVEGPEGFIMIDDGFSRREVLNRMHELDIDEGRVRALLITHEHSDHVSGVRVWCNRFHGDCFASVGTAGSRRALEGVTFTEFMPGDSFTVAGVDVATFPTSHDVKNPVGYVFRCQGDSVGIVTDTGVLTPGATRALAGMRILALESNHDVAMLRTGPYPRQLQDRILSDQGHLSNDQAAAAAQQLVGDETEWLVAMHISQENNRPSLAVRALAQALDATLDNELGSSATLTRTNGSTLHIRAAGQNRPLSVG